MERFSHRENVLLGYSPQRAFANPSSSTKAHQFRNSDVDFHDVFGGPPRRSSICEMRYSSSETMDSCSFKGDEETLSSRYSWTGVSEKPVFGEEGVNRRRSPSDDFFDDIFRGDDSSSSTPRKHDRDLFSSAPDSRLLSPAHPLPPKAEPFGSSSLPAQFSLPAKLANGMDFAAFASATRNLYKSKDGASNGKNYSHSPSASVSRFSSQAILGLDDSRNDVRPSYCQSPLSHEFSLSSEGSSKVKKSDKTDIVGNLKKDSNSLAVPSNCHQFHFSIYKWASKGVPLVMPPRGGNSSRLKEKGKTQRCSSSNGRVESESVLSESATAMRDIDFHSLNSSISASTKSLKMESEKKDNDSLLNTTTQDRVEPCQIAEEAVLAMPESKPPDSLQITVENVPGILCDTREETKPHSLPEIGLCEITEKEISVFTQETRKPDLKPLHSLLYDNDDGQGSDVITRKGGGKENMVKTTKKSSVNVDVGKNVKKQDRKRIISKGAEVDKASLQGSPINSGDNLGRNGIKGKVKEFVKIFNQEASSKPLINVGIRSQSFRWKNKSTHRAENEASVSTTGTDGKMHMPNVSKKKTYPDASFMVDENLKQSEKQHSGINTTIHKISDTSGQKNNSAPSSESIPDCSTTLGNTDESFEGNFLIKELSQDQNEPPQTGKDYEEKQVMQVSDAKIRQWSNGKEVNVRSLLSTLQYWSNGKEGNIRSLLSTLQYVLWPESGWKPVPLVDIIEGNAVKKAYQKALLCLHPDKLQQKGAASHQKYIAEKVFDILQEAWTHFNSLGSL